MTAADLNFPLLIFVAVAFGSYAVLTILDPYWLRVRNRVRQLEAASSPRDLQQGSRIGMEGIATSPMAEALRRINPSRAADRANLQQRLARAGIHDPAAVARLFSAKLLLTVLLGGTPLVLLATGHVPVRMAIAAACFLGGFGYLAPGLWLDRAIARYHLSLQKALPDFLDLMTVCLEGGISLHETIRRVGDELRLAHPALAAELEIVQRDVELGSTIDQALKRFANRTDSDGVRSLSTFIREAQRIGTNIADALRSHADMLRTQREQAAEERAQKAAVKILLPTMLLIFPATFVVMVGPAAIQIREAFAK